MGGTSTLMELSLAAVMAATTPAFAQETEVDLALVIAVDVSRSMDFGELELQRDGYVAAFRHPEVIAAIGAGATGRIAVTYLEWAGAYQSVTVPWRIIAGRADAEAFADELGAVPITRERGTSISGGLMFAARQLAAGGFQGLRRAIDVSGDGPNNTGLPVVSVRDQLIEQGITINGLPILVRPSRAIGPFGIPNLDVYYEDCVIGGPGAFMITVEDKARLGVAVRRKLVLEIAGLPPHLMAAGGLPLREPRVDCLIGEKLRGQWADPLFR